jgi:hypothetical protein
MMFDRDDDEEFNEIVKCCIQRWCVRYIDELTMSNAALEVETTECIDDLTMSEMLHSISMRSDALTKLSDDVR